MVDGADAHPVVDLAAVAAEHPVRDLPYQGRHVHGRQIVADDVGDVLQYLLDPSVVVEDLHLDLGTAQRTGPQEPSGQGLQRAVRTVGLVQVLAQPLPFALEHPQQGDLGIDGGDRVGARLPGARLEVGAGGVGGARRHDQSEGGQFGPPLLGLLRVQAQVPEDLAQVRHPAQAQLLIEGQHPVGRLDAVPAIARCHREATPSSYESTVTLWHMPT